MNLKKMQKKVIRNIGNVAKSILNAFFFNKSQKRFFSTLINSQICTVRESSTRNKITSYSWLTSYNSFSFVNYYSPQWNGLGNLRVLNEDFVSPSSGFEEVFKIYCIYDLYYILLFFF
jgi:hypothetical protein